MSRTNWKDLPNTTTPITAENLKADYDDLYNSIYYKSGDTYNATGITPCNGFITGSSKSINCILTLPKKLTNISSITVNSYDITARQAQGGYALNRATSGLTVTASKLDDMNIAITITTETTLTATNNTPISVALYALNLTFN